MVLHQLRSLHFLPRHLGDRISALNRLIYWGWPVVGIKQESSSFLVANAFENGADTLNKCGAVQSKNCRLTLAAAVKEA